MSSTSVLFPTKTSVLPSNPLSASEADVFAPVDGVESSIPVEIGSDTDECFRQVLLEVSTPCSSPKKLNIVSESIPARAFVVYNRERVEVVAESTFVDGDGRLWASVKAVSGYPFNGQDIEACGDYSGGAFPNCNGRRVRAEFVIVEPSPTLTDETQSIYMQHPLTEAEQQAAEVRSYSAWLTAEAEDKLTDKVSKMLKNFDVPNRVIISGGEVLEVEPYRPASDNDDMPF